jgi:hypothetical protein
MKLIVLERSESTVPVTNCELGNCKIIIINIIIFNLKQSFHRYEKEAIIFGEKDMDNYFLSETMKTIKKCVKYYNEPQYVIFDIINKNKENYLKVYEKSIITKDLIEKNELEDKKIYNNNEPINNGYPIIRSVRHIKKMNVQQKKLMTIIKTILHRKGNINFI